MGDLHRPISGDRVGEAGLKRRDSSDRESSSKPGGAELTFPDRSTAGRFTDAGRRASRQVSFIRRICCRAVFRGCAEKSGESKRRSQPVVGAGARDMACELVEYSYTMAEGAAVGCRRRSGRRRAPVVRRDQCLSYTAIRSRSDQLTVPPSRLSRTACRYLAACRWFRRRACLPRVLSGDLRQDIFSVRAGLVQ